MLQNKILITFWELILVRYLSVVCFASLTVHWISIVCGDIETEIHLFFYCNFHDDARAILSNRVCNIVIDNKSPEFFVCLSNVELLRIFLFGLPDEESSRISVAVFRPVDDFLKSCNRFDNIRATLYTIYGRFVLSCCIFLLMPIGCNCHYICVTCLMRRPRFNAVFNTVDAFL